MCCLEDVVLDTGGHRDCLHLRMWNKTTADTTDLNP